MRMFRRAVLPLLVSACTSVPLAAQQAEDGLAPLRTKTALTEQDQAAIRAWANERVVTIVNDGGAAAQQAFAQLRGGCDGSNEFRGACVAACIESVGSACKKAPLVPATRLITLLTALNDLRGLDVLLEALQDDRTAVRAAAVVALRGLRHRLAGNAELLGRTIGALREAGSKESSRTTLQLIYRAMAHDQAESPADHKVSATAVLAVLEERVKQLSGRKARAEGADYVGLQVVGALRNSLDEGARRRYTTVLAQMLHYGVRRYTAGGKNALMKTNDKTSSADVVTLRNSIELLIAEAEQQLTEILSPSPAPNIAERMKKADDTNIVNEMNKWAQLLKLPTGLDLTVKSLPEGDEGESEEGGP